MDDRTPKRPPGAVITDLQERAKELKCLYRVETILSEPDRPAEDVFRAIIEAIPEGWHFPAVCQARVRFRGETYSSPGFVETPWVLSTAILVQDAFEGTLYVSYMDQLWPQGQEPFLKEESTLLETIARRLGEFIFHQRLKRTFHEAAEGSLGAIGGSRREWRGALHLLMKTEPKLFEKVARKMMNYLGWKGIAEARILLQRYSQNLREDLAAEDVNQPQQIRHADDVLALSEETFRVAEAHLNDDEILERIQKWVNEDRTTFLLKAFASMSSTLSEIYDALHRYHHLVSEGIELSPSASNSIRVALICRFLSEQRAFVGVSKKFLEVDDFTVLMDRVIAPAGSKGHLGGKSAGLFLAQKVLKKSAPSNPLLGEFKTPRTWYLTTDAVNEFIDFNNLDEVWDQKYKEIDEVRQEYPHIVQVFKNSRFPPEIVKSLAMVLDDLGDVPLIVRSSSLLEDRHGTSFSGKYKSLFLANQGEKADRLKALMDAIAEVYASTFSPDPIEYRAERELLDFSEEMGIMIEEVVGARVGNYFFPAFAGVAFSNNELRWSPRIKREDGLLRLVPGLGTRAVDRLADDYPILIAPGQPHLRVNVLAEEFIRYSPKKIDVINLEKNCFETLEVSRILSECGDQIPGLRQVYTAIEDGMMNRPLGFATDFERDTIVASFEGLIEKTPFLKQMSEILKTLKESLGFPVDIEFAHDGKTLYLLQCRPQSHAIGDEAMEIPKNVPDRDVLFTANRYVSNGKVPDITHVVYVDPERYSMMPELVDMMALGQAVGRLNKFLPKRQFILMGPGRWGSRGDIKLGVRITYSEINNTAMLIEIARKQGNYVPDLSFGTHFFQDLVEASIRYLPLYPDDETVRFNQQFLLNAPNILGAILPEFAYLSDTLRVIDVPGATAGKVLRVLMNADQEDAIAMFAHPSLSVKTTASAAREAAPGQPNEHASWRLRMAERFAAGLDGEATGVRALYVIGSTKNGTARPDSDLDVLVQFAGNEDQRRYLDMKLDCWSQCLAELNYMRTGQRKEKGLLDVVFVTDDEVKGRVGPAVKIGSVIDPARQLVLKGA